MTSRTFERPGGLLRIAGCMFTMSGCMLALSGCGVLPPIPVFEHVNQQVTRKVTETLAPDPTGAATPQDERVPRASERPGSTALQGNVFIGLGVSGGGARAANFGAAVMQQLETLGLMQRVTVLSSVSGGGLPAAWYGLHGDTLTADNLPAWDRLRDAMSFDFRQEWQHSVLAPPNLLATFVSGLNRSDLMIQVFERRLFHGATFSALGPVGPRRPVILFNATNITNEGVGFAFSEEEFSTRESRLDTFPIARAVMASGAFPGAFSSVTLRNHPPRRPDGTTSDRVAYTHLMDGGPADNHGIDKLLQTARSAWQRSPQRDAFSCLLIIVDAHVVNHSSERKRDRDLRNAPLDYLVDPNVFEAIDTLLVQRRTDSLMRLGLALPGATRDRKRDQTSAHFAQAVGGPERRVEYYERVIDFNLPVQDIDAAARSPRCRAWHVALNEIRSLRSGVRNSALGVPDSTDAVLSYRAGLWEGVTRIKTDYRLTGPANCSIDQLQGLLYRAAEVTVREDQSALDQVCQWLGQHAGAPAEAQCRAGLLPSRARPLPYTVRGDSEDEGSEVNCPAPRAGRAQ